MHVFTESEKMKLSLEKSRRKSKAAMKCRRNQLTSYCMIVWTVPPRKRDACMSMGNAKYAQPHVVYFYVASFFLTSSS